MTAKRKNSRPICFVRHGNALVPDMEIDLVALDGIANGQRVRVEIEQWRNDDRLRAWWAYLWDCLKATGENANWSLEALGNFVKLNCGHFEVFELPDGTQYKQAKSIAKASKMTEAEMVQLFRATELFLAERFGFEGRIEDDGSESRHRLER